MKKDEYSKRLAGELQRRGIKDVQDIVAEYQQHFAFKEAEGVPEEEVVAKLGAPETLAAQFAAEPGRSPGGLKRAGALAGLGILGALSWIAVAATWIGAIGLLFAGLGSLLGGVVLAFGREFFIQLAHIPYMPAASALLFGLALLFLGLFLLLAWRHVWRGCIRFQAMIGGRLKNAIAAARGRTEAVFHSRRPQAAAGSRLRNHLMWGVLAAFLVFALAAMVVSVKNAGGMPFWHIWGWFGYDGPLKGV